jgi:hypothetical protein
MKAMAREDGVALILSIIILLVISTLATTIAFVTYLDVQTTSNYKRGQEAFLAAERCVGEARRMFETLGIEVLYFNLQGGEKMGLSLLGEDGSYCRTGDRFWENPSSSAAPSDVVPPFVELPPPSKAMGRPQKQVSLPWGGVGGAALVPATFTVVGKDKEDKDLLDKDPNVNTGVEIAVGYENFIPGGASNVY